MSELKQLSEMATEELWRLFPVYLVPIDEIYFCAYLNERAEVAAEYGQLKLRLWKLHKLDRDAYTSGKRDFVQKYTALAKKLYG